MKAPFFMLLIVATLLTCGCHPSRPVESSVEEEQLDTFTTNMTVFKLEGIGAENKEFGVRLLKVERDSATIEKVATKEVSAAKIGKNFPKGFGQRGLWLRETDPNSDTAIFVRYWAS